MLHTTFRKAKEARACIESYRKFAKSVGGVKKYGLDTPIPLDKILEVCDLDDAIWCLSITLEHCEGEARLFACDCVERVLPLFEKQSPDDERPRRAIEISYKFANGNATKSELDAARAAAWAAARDAWAAAGDARDAAWAAGAAARAAGAAAWAAAWAAGDAARDAEIKWQTERFLFYLNGY